MSVTSYVDLGAVESFEEENVDFSPSNVVAMEVEAAQSSETKTSDVAKRDDWWRAKGPFSGPQAMVDNEVPVPATNSVVVESFVLASKTHDELVQSMDALMSKLTHLTHRVSTLEEELKKFTSSAASQPSHDSSASASQPQDDAVAASSACGSLHNKRKTARQFKVPKFDPWPMNSGGCHKCHREWSTAESPAHFMLCLDVWQQAMNKIFQDFTAVGGLAGGYYDYIEGSVHTPYTSTNSLVACNVITEAQAEDISSMVARMLWQPDVHDKRCWFLFKAGEKNSRYVTFGCIHCQRGTSRIYRSDNFLTDLRNYFQ